MTPDTDKLVRQLSLVAYLMAERRASSARDVKQNVEGYYDMSDEAFARRFYADRAELSALGVPIRSQRDEFTGEELYTLRREQYFLPPLHLTDAELAALATGVYLLEGQFAYAEPLRLALQNLALGRPNPSEDSSPGVSLRLLGNGFTADVAQRLQKIESAVSKQRTIVFPYWAIYSDEQSTRTMDPYSLFLRDGQWYLVGRDHDRDAIRTFRLSRIKGDVRFATRRERDFRIPPEFDATQWRDRAPWQLGETDEIATIRVSPSAAWLVERAASRHGNTSYQEDGSLVFETPFADARLLARWLLDLDGQAVPLAPPDLVDEVTAGLDRVSRAHEGPAAPHAAPTALVERTSEPPGRGGESPVAPERFAVLQALMADLLDACGDEPRARIPAVPLAARYGLVPETLEEHLQLLNLVSFGGGCYAVYSELVENGTVVAVEKELYGDDFRQPARLSPLEAKALLLALDLIGPLVAADSGTPLSAVRAKVEASFGGYTMLEAPEPGSSPLPEDVLSVLSRGVREHRVVRMEYLSRRGDGVGPRVIEPHRIRGVRGDWYVDTYDRTANGERTFRVDRIRSAELDDEVFVPRPGVGDRDDDELSKTAGTASVWFSPEVARWELEGRPDTIPLADGGALASVPYGSERWLATELCRYLGDAVLLEPEGLRTAVAARARELGAGSARAGRLAPRHPVIRYLSDDEVAGLLPAPADACELARRTLVELAQGLIDLPPKPSVRPRPDGFVNAMPAYCSVPDAAAVKIVGVYQGNRARGLPTIAGVVISIDPETGRIRGILGAGALTAARTAAASGACIARLAPAAPGPVGMTGAGVEARTHLLVADALGWHDIVVYDHRPANVEALRRWAGEHVPALQIRDATSPGAAADGAAIVVTGIPIGATGGLLPERSVRGDALVLPIDYSTSVAADLANSAELLASDDPDQLAAVGRLGHFAGWRALDGPTGRWLADDAPPRPAGRVVIANLGVGAHDAVFATSILDRAESLDQGTLLAE